MLVFILILVCSLGYLAQSAGLCMVRGVNELRKGKPDFLISILFSGVLTWVAIAFAVISEIPADLKIYAANIWFAVGGGLFGLGAAFNQGCGVSTLNRLMRGESKMLFTIIGWLIGWTILAYLNITATYEAFIVPPSLVITVLLSLSVLVGIWTLLGNAERKKLWLKMISIGFLAGFVYLFDSSWTPSGLLFKISHAFVGAESYGWPSLESYLLVMVLLIGMLLAAWRSKKFKLERANWKDVLVHALAGTLMGIGASLALGGNDSQILLAMPALSPAGLLAIFSIVCGIWFGLLIRKR